MQKLTSYALKLLAKRGYTISEITKKISLYAKRKNIPPAESEAGLKETLSKLSGWGYLNDAQLAEQFIRSRLAMKPKSLRAIEYELQKKGVSREIAQAASAKAGIDEHTSAQKVLALHQRTLARLPEEKRRAKVYRLLKTRGFTGSIVTDIMRTFFN